MRETEPVESPPPGRWAFAGREEQLDLVASALRSRTGRGVVLAGGAGGGRSRLPAGAPRGVGGGAGGGRGRPAGETARAFGAVQRVVGTRCGAALPFSAFAGLRAAEGRAGDP